MRQEMCHGISCHRCFIEIQRKHLNSFLLEWMLMSTKMHGSEYLIILKLVHGRACSEPGGTWWRTGGEVKGKLANWVGSQYSHSTSERGLSSITKADAHTSAASSRLNWRPHRFEWTRPFRVKTKSGFCACAITFRTSYTATCISLAQKERNFFTTRVTISL